MSATVQRKLGRPLVIDTSTVLRSGLSSIHSSKTPGGSHTLERKARAPRCSLAGITGGEASVNKEDNAVKKRAKSVGSKHAPTIVLAHQL